MRKQEQHAAMKVAIVGSRGFEDYALLCETMATLDLEPTQIISGGAKGADALAARYAAEHGIDFLEIPAQWGRYGKSAGMIRNREIVRRAEVVVAFWDGQSPGTAYTVDLARKAGKRVEVVETTSDTR